MASYLERYLSGEHEQVWRELTQLGADVRLDPNYPDALAVARETMRRAHQNIELLVPRLRQAGYTFGFHALGLETTPPALAEAYHVFLPPSPDIVGKLDALEERAGVLPLSLRAWYEAIGEVNLIGRPPEAWQVDPLDLDPFQVDPLEYVLEFYEPWLEDQAYSWSLPVEKKDRDEIEYFSQTHLEIMLDVDTKFGYSGLGGYQIIVPCQAAGTLLESEPHELTFVDYVRLACRWGGFPGLQFGGQVPDRVIRELTEGLLPL